MFSKKYYLYFVFPLEIGYKMCYIYVVDKEKPFFDKEKTI